MPRKKRKNEVEKEFQFSDVAITDTPLTEALVLRRHRSYPGAPVIMTNVPHLVVFYSETGYAFGYHGKGPLDLALNICEWYLLHIGFRGQRIKENAWRSSEKGDYFEMSFSLHHDFHAAFIEKVPEEGVTVPFAELKDWFDKALEV
jgi:hypothetical protein